MKKIVFWAMMTLGVVSLQSCDKDDDDRLQVSANLKKLLIPDIRMYREWTGNRKVSFMKLNSWITDMRTRHGLLPTAHG